MPRVRQDSSGQDGPGLERTVALTDAVVAIAMTLLVLPLVEASSEIDADHLGSFFGLHQDLVQSFIISFLVIYVFWSAHGRALARLAAVHNKVVARHDEETPEEPAKFSTIRLLNMGWLLLIAFLPFPTAVVGRDVTTTSATLYIGTMTALSVLTSAITFVVDQVAVDSRRGPRTWLITVVFASCAVIAAFNADAGMYALLALVPLRAIEARIARSHQATTPKRAARPGLEQNP